jgi:ParE toxin of type II toxin-antitoxin system, parDE
MRMRFLQLAQDPFDPRLSSPLTERAGMRKSRVGNWRILFLADRNERVVYVITVDTRGQVYKHSLSDAAILKAQNTWDEMLKHKRSARVDDSPASYN